MLRQTLQNIIEAYGSDFHLSLNQSGNYFNDINYSVRISWGSSKKNRHIFGDYNLSNMGAFIIDWRNQCPIQLKSFRSGRNFSSAKKRAEKYIDKLNRWANK